VSKWISGIEDICNSGQNYKPLILSKEFWNSKIWISRYNISSQMVIHNFESGDHDYDSVMELLVQSNPTIFPVCTVNDYQLYQK